MHTELLNKIDLEIDAAKEMIRSFEEPLDVSVYEAGSSAGQLSAWQTFLRRLRQIRKLTPDAVHVDRGIECPECGADFDSELDPPEFVLAPDGRHKPIEVGDLVRSTDGLFHGKVGTVTKEATGARTRVKFDNGTEMHKKNCLSRAA